MTDAHYSRLDPQNIVPVCQNITTLDDKLTWKVFCESGTHKLVTDQVYARAVSIVSKEIPKWLNLIDGCYVDVVTRILDDKTTVVTRAYCHVNCQVQE